MTNIKFTEGEVSELTHFYQLELNKTLKKAEDITGILSKLKSKPKRVRRTKAQLAATVKPKQPTAVRRYRKTLRKKSSVKTPAITTKTSHIKWSPFIPDVLKKEGRPLTTNEILNVAVRKFNIVNRRKGFNTLAQTLRNMTKKGQVIAGTKQGDNQKHYSLVS